MYLSYISLFVLFYIRIRKIDHKLNQKLARRSHTKAAPFYLYRNLTNLQAIVHFQRINELELADVTTPYFSTSKIPGKE